MVGGRLTENEVNAHVGGRLRRLRIQRGITAAQIGQWLGVGEQMVCKYETGHSRLSPAKLIQVAARLGIPVDDLFLGLPGAESIEDDRIRAIRSLRGYVARWGLDHPDPQARAEAREVLRIANDDESQGA